MKLFFIGILFAIMVFICYEGVYINAKNERAQLVHMIEKSHVLIDYSLPPGVTNVVYIGNHWTTFDLQNRHFLFHHFNNFESLTELSK
jgi:hypothetical protein